MTILLAPDKFKGSLSAKQVCAALIEGLRKKYPHATIISTPLADGGEGTSELLTNSLHGDFKEVMVTGPLFEKINASYGFVSKDQIAFIEMAKASGLHLIATEKRNPLHTTTFGTGELIKDALDRGAKKIVLGIGGSATNDAGIGMAEALGYQFYDQHQKKLKPTGGNLIHLDSISNIHVHPRMKEIKFIALCDVNNPLHGSSGAAFIYGAQKGADAESIELLDRGLQHFERVVKKSFGIVADFPGAGAGGGMASGASVFLKAEMKKGIDYVMDILQLDEKIKQADLVITGEGKIDTQTLSGKVVASVARSASHYQKPVIAFCGVCELREEEVRKMGIQQLISLTDIFTTEEEAIKNASILLGRRVMENL